MEPVSYRTAGAGCAVGSGFPVLCEEGILPPPGPVGTCWQAEDPRIRTWDTGVQPVPALAAEGMIWLI